MAETDSNNQAEVEPKLLDFDQERIRVLHFTWIAFFMTFYVWFNLAPLSTTMREGSDWLTKEHVKVLLIANVALTIPARIVVGALIDRFGSRIVFSWLMVTMSIPAIVFAFVDTFNQMLIARLVLSCVGAGFVIGIKMVAQWFPPKYIGRTEGFYAGWGNFGSAWAAMTLPWIAITVFGDWFGMGEDAWRWAMALNGLVMGIYGVMYYFLVRDVPDGRKLAKTKKAEPMLVSSYKDLVQYLVWSMPLVGALGVLAWRISNVKVDGDEVMSDGLLYVIYAVLTAVYIGHVVRTLQVNLPYLKAGVPEDEKYNFGSVVALNSTYFANFGAELAVVSMLPAFFETVFEPLTNSSGGPIVTATVAGLVAASFAFVNLVARPLGGFLSDKLPNRRRTMLGYILGIVVGFVLMGFIAKWTTGVDEDGLRNLAPAFGGVGWLVIAVIFTVFASVFVQGAEGATFAIIPMVNKRMTGQVAGMAGAYGNVGAVIYLVIFSLVDARTFFFILAAGAAVSFLITLLLLEEPEGAFSEGFDDHIDPTPDPTALT
ncbi:MAG: MFS transporter [Actinomycetia bacterium]|nr:MFS transporter [Actinomycetes bacterium]MCP4958685.1 MFS transporter [Actinomycetes bacterium]